MNEQTNSQRTRRPAPIPVFILPAFDPQNPEHMKGNMTLTLNKAFATQLAQFIADSDLNANEGHFFAMQAQVKRWLKDRFLEIKRQREGISSDEAVRALEDQIPEGNRSFTTTVTDKSSS